MLRYPTSRWPTSTLCLGIAAILLSGCSLSPFGSERPSWSLTDEAPEKAPTKKYDDWHGPGTSQPLRLEDGEQPSDTAP